MPSDISEDRLYRDATLVQFYDAVNGWDLDLDFCLDFARGAGSLLDLGCGTGMLAARLAGEGVESVFGADPAAAMLAVARQRPGGDKVTWVEADARRLRLDRRFERIVLTGHAFQVFLSDADRAALLATIAAHLAPNGRFVFDSRNPLRAAWRDWSSDEPRETFEHPEHGTVEAWSDVSQDPETEVVTYETFYRVRSSGARFEAASQIAFPSQETVAAQIADAGLVVEAWFGDWQGGPWSEAASDFIPVGRLA